MSKAPLDLAQIFPELALVTDAAYARVESRPCGKSCGNSHRGS